MNGVYDRLPPEAKIVDGNEEFGYKANDIKDYERLRCENDFLLMRLVDKANYRKARMQTQLAPAFYLDAYLIPQKGRVWFELLSPEKADRVSRFTEIWCLLFRLPTSMYGHGVSVVGGGREKAINREPVGRKRLRE